MSVRRLALLWSSLLWWSALSPAQADDALQTRIRKSDVVLKPNGAGPFPAAILLHGCSGPSTNLKTWAERLRDWGYLTLRMNSFAARELKTVCGGLILEERERVPDVLAAVAYLRTRKDVVADRLAIMGWSHGAGATLMSLSALHKDLKQTVRAAIAFYPGCRRVQPWRDDIPTLMLLGEVDNWTPPASCQYLAKRQRGAGYDVTEITYPGAYHAFDSATLGPEERRVSVANGGKGATIQYNPAAAQDSVIRVREFLAKHLASEGSR